MLDERQDPVRHEPSGSDRGAAPRHLGDLDDPARGRDLHTPPAFVASIS
jgi:hypothetical protein